MLFDITLQYTTNYTFFTFINNTYSLSYFLYLHLYTLYNYILYITLYNSKLSVFISIQFPILFKYCQSLKLSTRYIRFSTLIHITNNSYNRNIPDCFPKEKLFDSLARN